MSQRLRNTIAYAAAATLLVACGDPIDNDTIGGALSASDEAAHPSSANDAHCEEAAAKARESKPHKISVCHIPPGNPGNAHTINISKKALDAHLAHGDELGGCGCSPESTEEPPGANPEDGGDNESGEGDSTPPSSPSVPPVSNPEPEPGSVCDFDQQTCDATGDCGSNQACDLGCCVDIIL